MNARARLTIEQLRAGIRLKPPFAKLWLIPQEPSFGVMVFDAVAANGKHFVMGHGLAGCGGSTGMLVSPVAKIVMERLRQFAGPDAPLYFVELKRVSRIAPRLREVLTRAPSESAIMLACDSSQIIDALHDYLEWQPIAGGRRGDAP